MNPSATYVYAGNRSGVLRRMIELGLKVVHLLPSPGSWLEKECLEFGLPTTTVNSKIEAVTVLQDIEFDVFVSAGFPYILPISYLSEVKPYSKFVNIHPSYLPDLRGADPIPGAILYRRDSGVTCHHMDDGIDTGKIICRKRICHFDGMDAKFLYHLCFKLEPLIFEHALERDFAIDLVQENDESNSIYYSASPADFQYRSDDSNFDLISRCRAFNNKSKGLSFSISGHAFRAYGVDVVDEKSVIELFNEKKSDIVVGVFEDVILVMRQNVIVRFFGVNPTPGALLIGHRIEA